MDGFDFKKHMINKMAFEIAKAKSLEEVEQICSKYHHVFNSEEKKEALQLGIELQKLVFRDPEKDMMNKLELIGADQKEFGSEIKRMRRDGRFDRVTSWIGLILSILSLLIGTFPPDVDMMIVTAKVVLKHLLHLMKLEGSK